MTKTFSLNFILFAGLLITIGITKLDAQVFTGEAKVILETEKQAMNKWINRNVWGYLNLFAEESTYFDNTTKLKLNGFEAIKAYIAPWDGRIYGAGYKMVNVDIKVNCNTGILTYNLYNFNEVKDTTALWNSTEIYQKIDGNWKIIHSHWSLVDLGK